MKTRINSGMLFLSRLFLVVAVAALLATCPAAAQDGEVLAQQILSESGFKGGLVVLVGERDANLAMSLGKAPNVLVHCLLGGRVGLADARRKIRDAGVYGQVSAMAWKGSRLPYADSMVNLLVLHEDQELYVALADGSAVGLRPPTFGRPGTL